MTEKVQMNDDDLQDLVASTDTGGRNHRHYHFYLVGVFFRAVKQDLCI